MLEIIKQKPLIAGIGITFLIGIFIGIVLFFTIFTKYAGASDGNRVGNHFMLATGGTARTSQWEQKIEGENWEEILTFEGSCTPCKPDLDWSLAEYLK